jgi:hypothetical protein
MKRPLTKIPPWTPRAGEETDWFIEWTLAELSKPPSFPPKDNFAEVMTTLKEQHGPIIDVWNAINNKDERAFVELMKDPRAAHLAFEILQERENGRSPNPVGRPSRPNFAATGSDVVDAINSIWLRTYGKSQRRKVTNPPTASAIASMHLKKCGLSVSDEEIEKYRRRNGPRR